MDGIVQEGFRHLGRQMLLKIDEIDKFIRCAKSVLKLPMDHLNLLFTLLDLAYCDVTHICHVLEGEVADASWT